MENFLTTFMAENAFKALGFAVPAIYFYLLIRREGDELRIRPVQRYTDLQLRPEIRNAAIIASGALIYIYSFELTIDIIDLFLFQNLSLQLLALPETVKAGIMAVSIPVFIAVVYYYVNDNRLLYSRLETTREKISEMLR